MCAKVCVHWSQSSFTAGSDSCHISCLLRSYHILLFSLWLYSTHTHSKTSLLPSVVSWLSDVRRSSNNTYNKVRCHTCQTWTQKLVCRAEWWKLVHLLCRCLSCLPLCSFTSLQGPPVCSASCHGDTVGLHTMRMGTLQQVWLRETHYLTQPFWLMRKICERSCHATGRPSLLGRRSGQGSAASWEGKQEEERRQRRRSGQ